MVIVYILILVIRMLFFINRRAFSYEIGFLYLRMKEMDSSQVKGMNLLDLILIFFVNWLGF